MLSNIKSGKVVLWMKKKKDERKRLKDLKDIAKQEKLWDMKLRGLR